MLCVALSDGRRRTSSCDLDAGTRRGASAFAEPFGETKMGMEYDKIGEVLRNGLLRESRQAGDSGCISRSGKTKLRIEFKAHFLSS